MNRPTHNDNSRYDNDSQSEFSHDKTTNTNLLSGYGDLLSEIKESILSAQCEALKAMIK